MNNYKTVKLKMTVYNRLKRHKQRNESFNDLIERILNFYEALSNPDILRELIHSIQEEYGELQTMWEEKGEYS
ncbi:MAG: hypothetical protein B6U95_04355 [Thermofilum sp. ex4484_82]|nr:MAG: hypothetical protein B6U95_04355 [Thermofilum sp. ex4484_82]OYT38421.1 MAG: hypothetical protein B6U96_04350 [Archaeoglobales archaeon ex4484_92]